MRESDPFHILKEGEIHFKSTKNLKDPLEDPTPHILLGDVLVLYRSHLWNDFAAC